MSDSFKVFNSLGKKKEVFYTNKKNQVSIKIIGFVGFTKFISQDLRGFRATLFSFARL